MELLQLRTRIVHLVQRVPSHLSLIFLNLSFPFLDGIRAVPGYSVERKKKLS